MKSFHGLLYEWVTLLVCYSIFISLIPANARAQEPKPKSAYQAADEDYGAKSEESYPELMFRGAKDNFGYITDGGSKVWNDPNSWWPVLVGAIVPTTIIYYLKTRDRSRTITAELNSLKKRHPELTPEIDNILAGEKTIRADLEKLLANAKPKDYRAIMKRLSPETTSHLTDRGIRAATVKKATTSLDELVDAINRLHALDVRKHDAMKRLGPLLEEELKLPKGSITRKLVHPDKFMSQGYGLATKSANPKAFAVELTRYEQAVFAEARRAGAFGHIPKITKETQWLFKFTRKPGMPWFSTGFWDNRIMLVARQVTRRMIYYTWPAAVGIGMVFVAVAWQRGMDEAANKKKDLENLKAILDQAEDRIRMEEFTLTEDALILMIQTLWLDMLKRFKKGKEGAFTMDCPYDMNDDGKRALVTQAFQTVDNAFHAEGIDPKDKTEESDKKAMEFIENKAKELGIPVPKRDAHYSTRFYRALWMELLAKAKEMDGGSQLANLPAMRDRETELNFNGTPAPLTMDELVNDLAIQSPFALQRAFVILKRDQSLEDKLNDLDAETKEKLFTAVSQVSPELGEDLKAYVARREAAQKSADRTERDPLDVDGADEKKVEEKPVEEKPAGPATPPANP